MTEYERLAEATTDRADAFGRRQAVKLTERPGGTLFRWAVIVGVIILVIVLCGGVFNFACGHANNVKNAVGPKNTVEQNYWVIRDEKEMVKAATIACGVKRAARNGGTDPTFVEDPVTAYRAAYEEPRADYDRRMANLYEAQLVRKVPVPSNLRSYPKVAPTLDERFTKLCPEALEQR